MKSKLDIPLYEEVEQRTVVQYLDLLVSQKKICKFSASLSGVKLTPGLAKKCKMSGLRRGVPDLVIISENLVLWIEMKRRGKYSTISKEQKEWINLLNNIPNNKAFVCYGADEAIELIKRFI